MTQINCLSCDSTNLILEDNYKQNIDFDQNYLGDMKIYSCEDCYLTFAHPMPSDEILSRYYSNVYRSAGRDLYESNKNFNEMNLMTKIRNYEYFSYLSTFKDLDNIKNYFDFGSHSGDFGFLLKKKFKKINLNACEKDHSSQKILNDRGYKNFLSLDDIDIKFDLITCFHSLEHLNNLNIFTKLSQLLNQDGVIFFEVPNCPFKKFYKYRPYDAPHLLFFNKESITNISKKNNLKVENLTTTSINFKEAFKNMQDSKNIFKNWKPGKKFNKKNSIIKNMLKKIIPNLLLDARSTYNLGKKFSNPDSYFHNNSDQWLMRGILKKNST
tara:strand:+ start:1665 stop:2642 length:978 start_codon:yes stop_codon:yes gene_type:complete